VAELQEQRLVAVRTRLEGITRPEQLHLAADPAAEGEIRELTGFLADHDARDPACAQARLLLGLLHWFRYLACCDSREFRE
jgi:hypothetical protein